MVLSMPPVHPLFLIIISNLVTLLEAQSYSHIWPVADLDLQEPWTNGDPPPPPSHNIWPIWQSQIDSFISTITLIHTCIKQQQHKNKLLYMMVQHTIFNVSFQCHLYSICTMPQLFHNDKRHLTCTVYDYNTHW